MKRNGPANFVCDPCSKRLKTKVICEAAWCQRCLHRCRVEPIEQEPEKPELDALATEAITRNRFRPGQIV